VKSLRAAQGSVIWALVYLQAVKAEVCKPRILEQEETLTIWWTYSPHH
jgi:hypothetical protein